MSPLSKINDYRQREITHITGEHQDWLYELGFNPGTKIRFLYPSRPIVRIHNTTYALSPKLLSQIHVD
jgi:hypothetical protein